MNGVDKFKGLLSKPDFFNAFAKMALSEPWKFNLTKPMSGRIFKQEKTPDDSPKTDQRTPGMPPLDLSKAPCGAEGMQSSSLLLATPGSSGQRPPPPSRSLNGSLNGSNTGPRLPKTPRMQDDDDDDADSDDNGSSIMNLWQVDSPGSVILLYIRIYSSLLFLTNLDLLYFLCSSWFTTTPKTYN